MKLIPTIMVMVLLLTTRAQAFDSTDVSCDLSGLYDTSMLLALDEENFEQWQMDCGETGVEAMQQLSVGDPIRIKEFRQRVIKRGLERNSNSGDLIEMKQIGIQ